jgi:hypothetical protein
VKLAKALAVSVVAYAGVVIAVESLVVVFGAQQASRGLAPGESWIVLTTRDGAGESRSTVLAGVESGGRLYVSA